MEGSGSRKEDRRGDLGIALFCLSRGEIFLLFNVLSCGLRLFGAPSSSSFGNLLFVQRKKGRHLIPSLQRLSSGPSVAVAAVFYHCVAPNGEGPGS